MLSQTQQFKWPPQAQALEEYSSSKSFAFPTLIVKSLVFVSLLLISCSDLYFEYIGLPVIPLAGFLLLVTVELFCFRLFGADVELPKTQVFSRALPLVFLCTFSAFYTSLREEHLRLKPLLGILMGIATLVLMLSRRNRPKHFEAFSAAMSWVMYFHLACFYYQTAYFFATGSFLDLLYPICGHETRSGITFMQTPRFTGFFAEPANYATFAYSMLVLRLFTSKFQFGLLEVLLFVSIGLSFSLFGAVLMLSVLLLSFLKFRSKAKGVLLLIIGAYVLFYLAEDIGGIEYLSGRITNLDQDGSVRDRLIDCWGVFSGKTDLELLFGSGLIDEQSGQLPVQGNGFIFLLHFFGFVGTAFFFLFLSHIVKGMPTTFWIFVLLTLVGFSPFTKNYWWAWIAQVVMAIKYAAGEPITSKRAGYA